MTAILPLDAGTIIGGHYGIEGLINTGGFGSVYRGSVLSEGNRPCAIKETYDVSPAARRQVLREASILFTVKSDHLPEVYDALEENGRFYLIMQLIEGQNCSQMIKAHGAPFGEQEVLDWLLPVADVLQELHGRNPPVLHRDIKPANIILTPSEVAVLVDFGLTRLYDPGVETQTMARAISEGFSPLEQYIGQTSPQSDIYSLAATMYYLLTASVPPASVARSMQDNLQPPRQLNPRVSPRVETVLLKALAINAEQRYNSMQEFARALRAPGFSGYAEPTLAQSSYQRANEQTEWTPAPLAPPPSASSSWPQRGQGQVHQSGQHGSHPAQRSSSQPGQSHPRPAQRPSSEVNRRTSESVPGWRSAPPPTPHPVARAGRAIPPPAGGSLSSSYAHPQLHRSLPRPFGHGCLWGVLQGAISALLLLVLKKDTFFYLGVLEGLVFYMLAGFFTTRYGGPVTRALRTGFWAGVISTLFYWIILPVGLLIEALPHVQTILTNARAHNQILPSGEAVRRAIAEVTPSIFANNPVSNSQSPQTGGNVLIFLAIGLACAMFFAFLGGLFGQRSEAGRSM